MQAQNQIADEINKLSKEVLDCCFYVHTKLGPGLLESVYEDSVSYILGKRGIPFERQKTIPIVLDDYTIPSTLRIDLLINNILVLEIKAVEKLIPIHEAQLHTYLKLSGVSLGLLVNFNTKSLKDGIKRIAMAQNQILNFV
jgi:GxxExxY protein